MSYKTIEILPYNLAWPQWFEIVKLQLSACLGNLALSIDHIGSTAIPGLGAKDRIDVQVTVEEITLETKGFIDSALIGIGLDETKLSEDHRPPLDSHSEDHWKKLYLSFMKETAICSFYSNIHFRIKGKANQIYALLFRDYLRCHPALAAAYQQMKEKLAEYHPYDIQAYCEIKDPACDIIMGAAQDWAIRVGWRSPV